MVSGWEIGTEIDARRGGRTPNLVISSDSIYQYWEYVSGLI